MAYNVAANMQFAKPVSAFIDARDNVTRNALAERQVANQEGAQAFQQQRLTATDQIAAEQRAKASEQEDSVKLHTAMQYLANVSNDTVRFQSTAQSMLQHPEIGRILQGNGVTLEDITPQSVQELLAATGVQAGQGPPDTFEEIKGPRGSIITKNTRTGEQKQIVGPDNTETPNYGAGAPRRQPPAGYDWGADGNLVVIPGGPADKANDAPKPATEGDKRARVMYSSMRNAEKQIEAVTAADTSNLGQAILGKVGAGKVLQSDEYKRYEAAGLRWAANLLYLKSGATATPEEINSTWKQFFPQIGDGQSVKDQKNEARLQEMTAINDSYAFGEAYTPSSARPNNARVPDGVAIHNKSKSGRDIVSVDGGKNWTYK